MMNTYALRELLQEQREQREQRELLQEQRELREAYERYRNSGDSTLLEWLQERYMPQVTYRQYELLQHECLNCMGEAAFLDFREHADHLHFYPREPNEEERLDRGLQIIDQLSGTIDTFLEEYDESTQGMTMAELFDEE